MNQTVIHSMLLSLQEHGGNVDLTAWLIYSQGDPLCVRLRFPAAGDGETAPQWVFARELLAYGLEAATGHGNVLVRPQGTRSTRLEVRSTEGRAVLRARTRDLRAFLDATYALVAPGQEQFDLPWGPLDPRDTPPDP